MKLDLDPGPLPAIQRPLWLACEASETPVYNEAEAFRLTGAVDPDAFRRALDALYHRHAALRTVVVTDAAGLPEVAVLPPGPFPLEQLDLRDQSLSEARRLGEQAAEATVRRMFVLDTGPLVRGSLIRCADEEWIFVLVAHHLISDDDSVRLLLEELSLLYRGGAPAPPPGAPFRAQRSLELPASDPQRAIDLEYWTRKAGMFAGMDIPTDRPAPDRPSYAGSRRPLPMEAGWFQRVQPAAMRLHVSPFAVVTAALSVVLARLGQTEDVAVATTVNMRAEADAEDVVGYFLKTIPLRLRVDENGTVAELVRQAHESVMEAIAHTSVEFDEIVSAAGRAESNRSSPFRVALELHYEAGELRLPDVTTTRLPLHAGTSAFDFTFHVYAMPGMSGFLEYSTEKYDEATAGSVAGAFAALVEQLCAGTDRPVADLTLEDVSDAAVLAKWESGPALDETALSPLPDAVRERAALHPDRPAVVCGNETVTFAQLVHHADVLGAALAAAGVSRGEVVGVAVRRSASQIAAAFGAWSAGAVCAALDPDLPEDRLRRMMRTAGIRTALVDAHTAARPAFAGVIKISAHLDDRTAPRPGDGPVVKPRADDTAYVIFTSGTSGDPKAVEIRHGSLAAFGQAMDRLIFHELPGHARVAVNAPFSFDASWQGTQLLRAGHTIYPVPDAVRADSEAMVDFLREHRIEVLDGTPTHVAALVDAGLLELSGRMLRVVVVGGEAVPPGLWQALGAADLRAVNVYGPTEFTVNATACVIESGEPQPHIGRPLAGVTARVLDPQKRRVPVGFPGELHLSGPQLAVGYAGQPERTAERFLTSADGSRQYVTGDLVRWRGDGSLNFLGRRDGQVKLRGYRIELAEIARVLRSAPGVVDAAAVVVGQGSPSAVLHAALVLGEPAPELSAVRAFAATQLPGYMLPASFAVLPELPRTTGGKLDLAAVAASARSAPSVPSVSAPSTSTARRLAAIWAALLGCGSVRDEDDFFALGGNSLFASRLVRRVETELGIRLPLQTIFGNRTLAAMADALDSRTAAGTPRGDSRDLVVPLVTGNGAPPLVMLHPLGGTLFAYQPLLRLLPPEVPVWGVRSPTAAGDGEEHPDVTSMVRSYASLLCERLPGRRANLFGWSLGGLIALAVAAELEKRGFRIEFVEIWDVGAGTEEALDESEMVRSAVRAVYGDAAPPQHAAVADDRLLQASLQVIRHQTALFHNWQPASIQADVHVVYAEPSLRDGSVVRTDWGRFAAGRWTEATVPAGHYEMMRDPAVAEAARGLLARLRHRS